MGRETFPHKEEGDDLAAEHVNKLGRVVRRFADGVGGPYLHGNYDGLVGLPPFVQRPVVVIANECDGDVTLDEIRLRYWDEDSNSWKSDDETETYCMDSRAVDITVNVGDLLSAYYDPQRGAFIPVVSSTGCDHIRFKIISATCDTTPKSAVVKIEGRKCGCTTVPEEVGGQVTVYDALDCFIDEPPDDLVDRKGYAHYMAPDTSDDGESSSSSSSTSGVDLCRWEITALCCPEECP